MDLPDDLLYHPEDTWARAEDRGRVRVGITDFAQDQLGDIIWVDLPEAGTKVTLGESFGEIESTKTVADLHAPVTGTVVESNSALGDEPDIINVEPYGRGWIVLVEAAEPPGDGLLDAAAYRSNVEARA